MRCGINMNRTTLSLALILGSSLFAACTTDGESGTTLGNDELGTESPADGEAAKADGIDTFGIYTAVKVGAFECNGQGSCTHVTLARANRSTTTCANGSVKASCDVRYLDFSKLGLSASKLDAVTTKLQASAATPEVGAQLLVRGKYVHGTSPLHPGVDWVTFQVTELWTAQLADGAVDGTFVMIRDNGTRCIDGPCPSISELRINSTLKATTNGLDWSTPSSTSLQNRVYDGETKTDGVIVTGYRTHGQLMHLPTTLRSVEQVYLLTK
ncbi:MAG: hypothetical protein JWO36_2667 [Myxococcales bacterium]|nr:hypothetical protein [Myxococcales bacterium]